MSLVVVTIGALIVVIGIAILLAPEILKKILVRLLETDRFYVIAILRIVIGVLFLLAAGSTRFPMFITIMGFFFILAGVLIPVIGSGRLKAFASWWLERGNAVIRLWALIAIALGAAFVWAGL
jgi:hypothetical protein